ERSVYQS
ncbi:hypothetical protein VCHENC02_2542C, partial [Vibrio harveyi]